MSLLPDLNSESERKKTKEPILKFRYDNNAAETDDAMRTFQKTFGSKRGWVMTVAYIVMLIAAGVLIAFNPKQPVLYLAVGLCVVFLIMTISAPSRRRKAIIRRINAMPPEDYECELFDDKIIIKTFIHENGDGGSNEEKPSEPVIQLLPFGGEYLLDFAENGTALLLFIEGKQYACFPKRCLTNEQMETLREVLEGAVLTVS